MKKLSGKDLDKFLAKLDGWSLALDQISIQKIYRFIDFKMAMDFMNQVAVQAEEMQHHPEWKNVYSSVTVRLTSHDKHAVTDKDIELAQFMNKTAKALMKA